jgi:hypothetical protein
LNGARPRVRDGKLILDVRTVFAEQEDALVGAVQNALQPVTPPRHEPA